RVLKAHIWVAKVGIVPLLMMDTGIDENPEEFRGITDRLYGGGSEHRLAQEVLLGIGGVRALRRFCELTSHPVPEVYHCNEGHAGFLGLERIREYLAHGVDFDTAVEFTRAGNVFTTHTPVPAGIDRFPTQFIATQFADFGGLPLDRILALGAEDFDGGDPGVFNMAIMGFRLGQRANGVSELHGEVSREMFQPLWPDFDSTEVPIGSVTNGVHHRTWIHPELQELLQATTSQGANVHDGFDFDAINSVDDNTLWALKRQMRGSMITMARQRLATSCAIRGIDGEWTASALSPHTLTFGFARRGASYKRLTLMLTDEDRLKRLLNDPERPIQIVIAGKSHPADETGKKLIQRMVQFCDQEDVRGKIVFLPDYDMSLAQPLYPGCDVWINNPLRPLEACGTSGMKASLNGAANLSIKDGWWDEWFDTKFGWAIPSAEGIADSELRDEAEAKSFYEIIENQIIPAFYDRDSHGLPQRWLAMVRSTISGLGPRLLASRMVQDYVTELYFPAAKASHWASADDHAHGLAQWKNRIKSQWDDVTVVHVDSVTGQVVALGDQTKFGAVVNLGRLSADDVEVQLVAGTVDNSDELTDIETFSMVKVADEGDGNFRYEVIAPASKPGSKGYLVRVVPAHDGLTNIAEMGLAAVSQ
ncbi:MAG: alpha-glucan family phosphorylase, partial [Propionibacteriaceae bacterium]